MTPPQNLTNQQISKIVEIITLARTDQQVKLRFGVRKRERLAAEVKAGLVGPADYRYLWIKSARDAILDTLTQQAKLFNRANLHDCCSVQDLVDILHSAEALLKAKLNE